MKIQIQWRNPSLWLQALFQAEIRKRKTATKKPCIEEITKHNGHYCALMKTEEDYKIERISVKKSLFVM